MSKPRAHKTPQGYVWYRLDDDAYGNPRIMAPYLDLVSPTQEREAQRLNANDGCASIKTLKQWAKDAVHGKTYRARWYDGGGIVWKSYLSDKQINDMIDGIQADE